MRPLIGLIGAIGCCLLACSPELHQRCDDGEACPNGFYCDGVWCFPDGVGPGARDGLPPTLDGAPMSDATPPMTDGGPPMTDGAPLDGEVSDGLVDAAVPDLGPPGPFEVGEVTPLDRVVSARAGPERDRVRVAVSNAARVRWGIAANAANCTPNESLPVEDDAIELPAEAWRMFAPEGRFMLCLRRGPDGQVITVGPFTVDERVPTLSGLNRDSDAAGVRLRVEADRDLETVEVFALPDCSPDAEVAVVRPAESPRVAEAGPVAELPPAVGVRFVDTVGNPSGCLEVRLRDVTCHDGDLFEFGNDGVQRLDVRAVTTDCDVLRLGEELTASGECASCTALLASNPDAPSYDHVAITAARARFATPRSFSTRTGRMVVDRLRDAVGLGNNRFALADGAGVSVWTRGANRWSLQRTVTVLDGPIVTTADVTGGGVELIVGNAVEAGDVRRLGPARELVGEQRFGGSRLTRLVPFDTPDLPWDALLGLDDQSRAIRFDYRNDRFASVVLLEDVIQLAPIVVNGQQAAILARAPSPLSAVQVWVGGEPVDVGLPEATPGCLTSGDWDADGAVDVIACVQRGLKIYHLDANGEPDGRITSIDDVSSDALAGAVIGHTDFDGESDAVVIDRAGRVFLIPNHPRVRPRQLDVPFAVRGVRALSSWDERLDALLLRSDAPTAERLYAHPTQARAERFSVPVLAETVVAGIGDVDGDSRDDVLLVDPIAGSFRLLAGGEPPFAREIVLPDGEVGDRLAATMGDFNGDGLADVAGYDGARLVFWFGRLNGQYPRFVQALATNAATLGLYAADWIADGRDELLLRTDDTVQHLDLNTADPDLGFVARGVRTIENLIDFRVANADDDSAGVQFYALSRDPGDDNLLAWTLDLATFNAGLDVRQQYGFDAGRLATARFAGQRGMLRIDGTSPDAEVVIGEELSVYIGEVAGVTSGDIDGDGQTDLLVLGDDDPPTLRHLRRSVAGDFREYGQRVAPVGDAVHLGDFNGDGVLDELVIERAEAGRP